MWVRLQQGVGIEIRYVRAVDLEEEQIMVVGR